MFFLIYEIYGNVYLSKDSIDFFGDVISLYAKSRDLNKYEVKVSYDTNISFEFYKLGEDKGILFLSAPPELKSEFMIYVYFDKNMVTNYFVKNKTPRISRKKMKKVNLTKDKRSILYNVSKIREENDTIYRLLISKNYYYPSREIFNFIFPSTNRITSPYGNPRIYNDGKIRYHKGVDFSSKGDLNVYAPEDGIVIVAREFYVRGNSVYIYHGSGVITCYYHLEEIYVRENETVKKGQVIGKMGNTGISSGVHLHWGTLILAKNAYLSVNPLFFVRNFKLD